jgi:hypothetical protein
MKKLFEVEAVKHFPYAPQLFAPHDEGRTSSGNSPGDSSTQAGAGSSRTPFDQSLLHDPDAPRDTQPLSPINAANTATPTATPTSSRNLPPQVVPGQTSAKTNTGAYPVTGNLHNDDNDANQISSAKPTRKLPISTLVGLSMAGGALAVLAISMLVRSVIPTPKTPDSPATIAQSPSTIDIQREPDVVMIPDEESQSSQPSSRENSTSRENLSARNENSSPEVTTSPNEEASSGVVESNEGTPENSRTSGSRVENTAPASTRRDASTQKNSDSTDNSSAASEETPRNRNSQRDSQARDELTTDSRASGRWTSARHGYSIAPPEGFRLRRTGRRTAWRGPNGSELLVEAGRADGSPREGWEKLDHALAKKYGAKYRNLGIREEIINGRDAAVWEFELDTKNGRVRKIDVAMHEGNRGYAILGSAPAERFDEVRSKIQSAVNSFRIENNSRRDERPARNDDDDDAAADGY